MPIPLSHKLDKLLRSLKTLSTNLFLKSSMSLMDGVLMGSKVFLFHTHNTFYLISTGLAQGEKSIQECKKWCQDQLRFNLHV